MITFDMVGKMSLGKATDKFLPYDVQTYQSGWQNKTLKFNMVCGDNRFNLQVKGGCFEDGHNDIAVFLKDGYDENGSKVKGEMIRVPFKDRLKFDRLDEVVDWKLFIIDLDVEGRRKLMEFAMSDIKEGKEVSADRLKQIGISSVDELEAAYEASCKKRHEYLSEWDFIDALKKVIESDKYKDCVFHVRGNYEMQYSEGNQRFYCNYVPTRVYLSNEEPRSHANVKLLFGADSLEDATEEKKRYYVNGWTMVYDSNRKENIPAPYTISLMGDPDNKEEFAKDKIRAKKFTAKGDEIREIGIRVKLVNGAVRQNISMDELPEDTQDAILLGDITFEEVVRELGGYVYGDRVTENLFDGLLRGYSKYSEETAYNRDMMSIQPIEEDIPSLFDDEDDDDLDDIL